MTKSNITSLRGAISMNPSDRVIFGYELLSQPDETLDTRIPGIRKRNEVILANANEEDIVLLTEPITQGYHEWLRLFGFGTDNIFISDKAESIPEIADDLNLKKWLEQFSGNRIYVPRYSSDAEVRAAKKLDARLFGCDETITLKFYDKHSFKNICIRLGLPVIDGTFVKINGNYQRDYQMIKNAISPHLEVTGNVIIKDLTSSAGANLYSASFSDMEKVIALVLSTNLKSVLIEPEIKVISEPHDTWAITLDERIRHIGTSDQSIKHHCHSGNVYPSTSKNIEIMHKISYVIAEMMRKEGYIGIFGIDYIEDKNGELYVNENNSRINGSTPALDLFARLEARHGQIESFILHQIRQGNPMMFDELVHRTKDILYSGKEKYCFFPLDVGLMSQTGALTILATGESYEHADDILSKTLDKIQK